MRQSCRHVLKAAFLIIIGYLFTCSSALALPIFARRYQTSCTTCHAMVAKLNPFGIAFRNNGYRIPRSDEKVLKRQDLSLGAPAWKQMWPKAVWPGAIPNEIPFAVRAMGDVSIRPSQAVNTNFEFPSGLGLYAAGPAGDTISFFGNIFISGQNASGQNSLSIDRAYAQFKLIGERPGSSLLTLKVGRIDTRAEPFSASFRRMTIKQFNATDQRPVTDGFGLRDRDAGFELWGAATGPDNRGGIEYAAGLLQGSAGRPEANNSKDYYANVSYKLGGYGVVGPRRETELLSTQENYSEVSIQVGAFGYNGVGQPRQTGVQTYRFHRQGIKLDAYLRNLNIYGTIVKGHDELTGLGSTSVDSTASFVEADYMLYPWLMPLVRLEKTSYSDGRPDTIQSISAANISIRANIRLIIEGQVFRNNDQNRIGMNQGLVRLDFLF